jgi:hypothetical protein
MEAWKWPALRVITDVTDSIDLYHAFLLLRPRTLWHSNDCVAASEECRLLSVINTVVSAISGNIFEAEALYTAFRTAWYFPS